MEERLANPPQSKENSVEIGCRMAMVSDIRDTDPFDPTPVGRSHVLEIKGVNGTVFEGATVFLNDLGRNFVAGWVDPEQSHPFPTGGLSNGTIVLTKQGDIFVEIFPTGGYYVTTRAVSSSHLTNDKARYIDSDKPVCLEESLTIILRSTGNSYCSGGDWMWFPRLEMFKQSFMVSRKAYHGWKALCEEYRTYVMAQLESELRKRP